MVIFPHPDGPSPAAPAVVLGPAVFLPGNLDGKNVGKPGKMQENRGKNMFEWERIISSIMGKKIRILNEKPKTC